ISRALPLYPDLEDLLDYISSEVQRLMDAEGALVGLFEPEEQRIFFLGACYDDNAVAEKIKRSGFGLDEIAAGRVIRTGEPQIVADMDEDQRLYPERDMRLGYKTRNFIEVPLRSTDRIIGVLCAVNKKDGAFDERDLELLSLVGGTVALSIENARYSEELKKAYLEVRSLNKAKDKAINHLSHELKTPLSVLVGSLDILSKRLKGLPEDLWRPTMERARRNLNRIVEIQDEVDDIIQERREDIPTLLSALVDQCADELETLVAQEAGEGEAVERIRRRIEEIYGAKDLQPEIIPLETLVGERVDQALRLAAHRDLDLHLHTEPGCTVYMPRDPLEKTVDGLLRNATENTPDQGKIEVAVKPAGETVELVVRDYGTGIPQDAQSRIFEGFFTTRETLHYSTRRPYDFNAGGKGADLLRMKLFSERYGFKISMTSTRCPFIPSESDVCPGRIQDCPHCGKPETCLESGGTTVRVRFPRHARELPEGRSG
ncbi:MAG: GAF domain-containing protein, partial [Desulfobacteraceae bacterium]